MVQFDQATEIDSAIALNTSLIQTDTTTNGAIVDTLGAGAISYLAQVGVVTAGDVTFTLTEGDDPALADGATVAAADITGTIGTLDTTNTQTYFGYVGKKRYVRLNAVTDNSADLTVTVGAIKGYLRNSPAA